MNTFFKWFILVLLVVAAGVFSYSFLNDGILNQSLSPKKTVAFEVDDLELKVVYNRPSKRNRDVFGALVPYNKVWRTGANEATTFETNKNLSIDNKILPAGKYTLWTIPNDTAWNVIFNSKMYPWGVNETMEAMRDPNFDVASIKAEPQKINTTVEQFTIAFDNSTDHLFLTLAWDTTKVAVPLK